MPGPTGIYIHVPFCEKRCIYCSFYSTVHGKEQREAFVHALCSELCRRYDGLPVSTVYLGGGTPSQLDEAELGMIFSALRSHCALDDGAEITFEANPDDISPEKARYLAQTGVNRVSLGVQSFDDERLSFLNRRHTARQALEAIDALRAAGIENISIDLIFGLPGQQLSDWQRELNMAFSLSVTHLSAYSLTYEEGTPLYSAWQRGSVRECDEEVVLSMFKELVCEASKAGFEHYEISNFAKPGFRSRHNSSYWTGVPYLGLGPGAHSYDGGNVRRMNVSSLRKYCDTNCHDVTGDVPHVDEKLTPDERYDELVFTRLRTREGLWLGELSERRRNYLLRAARRHLDGGRLRITPTGRLQLTAVGIFVSDDVMADLMWA